jgi:hypothetical protein
MTICVIMHEHTDRLQNNKMICSQAEQTRDFVSCVLALNQTPPKRWHPSQESSLHAQRSARIPMRLNLMDPSSANKNWDSVVACACNISKPTQIKTEIRLLSKPLGTTLQLRSSVQWKCLQYSVLVYWHHVPHHGPLNIGNRHPRRQLWEDGPAG